MALSEEDIFSKVQDALVDALGVDDDEVNNDATLVGDLGAESIDFLDIVFKLEKAFDITIPARIVARGHLDQHPVRQRWRGDSRRDGRIETTNALGRPFEVRAESTRPGFRQSVDRW